MKNVSQIYGFLIKDFIDIHKDIIDLDIDVEFDVIPWLLKDIAPFGFVNVPFNLLGACQMWEYLSMRSNYPKPECHYWCILMSHSRSMVFNLPTHHLEVNAPLRLVKFVADTKGIKMLNNVEDKWQPCRSRSLTSWAPLAQESHPNSIDFDSVKRKVPQI